MKAIVKTIELLQRSADSAYARISVNEIITSLQAIQTKFEQTGRLDTAQLSLFFGPTGSIQEIAIDNDWRDEFLELAKKIDGSIRSL
jgi:hypothetical protein